MLSVLLYCQGFLIYAALSKQYAVFTNISETIIVQVAKLFLTSRRDEKEIWVVIFVLKMETVGFSNKLVNLCQTVREASPF
jgi:hypothetical protein